MTGSREAAAARAAIVASLDARGLAHATEGHVAVFDWAASRRRGRTWTLGISGPQGGGKSTLAESLRVGFEATGLRTVAISIDDFYLTRAEQVALARAHPDDDFLSVRGYPGTHDVGLGARVLSELRSRTEGEVEVPRYDKTAHGGLGDRAPRAASTLVTPPADVVVLEGWMVGFEPLLEGHLDDVRLVEPNRRLAAYGAWWSQLDSMLVMVAPSIDRIVAWRVDAERARRRAGMGALDDAAAHAYAERFVPAYRAYLPSLVREVGRERARVALDEDRAFSSVERREPRDQDQGSVG